MLETPQVPLNVRVNKVQQLSVPNIISVSWDVPDNNERFDLEHFKVHIMLPEQENCIANGTSMEPEYRFHSDMIPSQTNSIHILTVHVTVTAVSKCSQQGLRSPRIEWRDDTDINTASMVTIVSGTVSKSEKAVGEDEITNGN